MAYSLREKGNNHYKAQQYENAVSCYIQALKIVDVGDVEEKAILHKNSAQCYLKLGQNKKAEVSASISLKFTPDDPKALFRRCQAYEKQGQLYNAFKDISNFLKIEPNNKLGKDKMLELVTLAVKDRSSLGRDTVKRIVETAVTDRDEQGSYCEMEVAFPFHSDPDFEGSPQGLFKNCKKHPGHKGFHPLTKLKVKHLPVSCRSSAFLKGIKAVAKNTVKLTVFHTSSSRPKNMTWKTPMRYGSGNIEHWKGKEFKVMTATHVVFDNDEVLETLIELFYYDDNDKSSVVRAKGVRLIVANVHYDYCLFIARLENDEHFPYVEKEISSCFENIAAPPADITFMISYPHGAAARVSFGKLEKVKLREIGSSDFVKKLGQLAIRAESEFGICEKKFLCFAMYCCDVILGCYETSPLDITPIQMKREITSHLIVQKMLQLPSDEEIWKLNKTFGQALGIRSETVHQMSNERRQMYGRRQEESGSHHSTTSTTSRVSDDKYLTEFAVRYRETTTEMNRKWWELNYGKESADHFVENITSVYELDTCPGSSGAMVTSFIMEDGSHLFHEVPHSKARKKGRGLSGGGRTFSLRQKQRIVFV